MKSTRSLVILAALFASATLSLAGPLNPPAGTVTGSGKTLTEVEPRVAINQTNTPGTATSIFKITQPGSYYLVGNLQGVGAKSGIEIAASGVKIDLKGFTLTGVAGSLDGIRTVGLCNDLSICDGVVSSFGQDGVDLAQGDVGSGATISGVHARANGARGLVTSALAVIKDCTAAENGSVGISMNYGCTIDSCTTFLNGSSGFTTGGGCVLTNCTAQSNHGDGIEAAGGSTVTNCAVRVNDGHGINAQTGGAVTDCAVQYNGLDGIRVMSFVTVRNNNCDSNGLIGVGAGVHALSGDNRIEGNACNNADAGIDVDSGGNVIIRNTCANNTINWSFVPNNVYGPILDRTGTGAPAVSSNAAAGVMATTDPNANFTH